MNNKMKRVDRDHPCPVCHRSDWCLRAEDGSAAICARIESRKRCGDAGWLHRLVDRPFSLRPRFYSRSIPMRTDSGPARDFMALAAEYQRTVDLDRLARLAAHLGLTVNTLRRFGAGWATDHRAWSFPMHDQDSGIIGIHLRRPDGRKLAVRGSRQGLFLPADLQPNEDGQLVITEGLTDATALADLGFPRVVGRPSCTGAVKLLCELVQHWQPTSVVLVADADAPGQRGANNLAWALLCYSPAVRIITPPAGIKDARQWLQAGGTTADVEAAITAAPERKIKIRSFLNTKG